MERQVAKHRNPYFGVLSISILVFVLLCLVTALIMGYIFVIEENALHSLRKRQEISDLLLIKERIVFDFREIFSDLDYLSSIEEIQAWLRDRQADPSPIGQEFVNFLSAKSDYFRIRLIDNDGNEIVSADRDKRFASKQQKCTDPYFTKALELERGNFYVSQLTLHTEDGQIIQPETPVIHIATPLVDANGKAQGVLLVNYLAREILKHIPSDGILLNQDGYWLAGGPKGYDLGFMHKKQRSFATDNPQKWQAIKQKLVKGQFVNENDGILSYMGIMPLSYTSSDSKAFSAPEQDDYFWILMTQVPTQELTEQTADKSAKYLWSFAGFAGFYGFVCFVFALQAVRRRKADEQFSILFKYSDNAHFIMDTSGVIDCNEVAISTLRVKSRSDIIGRHLLAFSPEIQPESTTKMSLNSATAFVENEKLALQSGNAKFDFTFQRQDGSLFPAEVTITPVIHGKKQLEVIILHDLTERKKTEIRVKELLEAVEKSSAFVIICDNQGIIEYVNPSFCKVTGYSREEVVGHYSNVLNSGEMTAGIYQQLWNSISHGKAWRGELLNKKKNGDLFWQLVSISPLLDESGDIIRFISIQEDISELKSTEQQLKRAITKAEEANRSKSEFLANMSHEIRTPMNSILGFAEILSSSITDKQQREFLESIKSSGNYLLALINDILDLSKVEAGKLTLDYTPFKITKVFDDVSRLFTKRIADKGLDFSVDIAPGTPDLVVLDEVRFRQIVLNLVGNALKFTDNGFISVKVYGNSTIVDNCFDLVVSVEDSGIGIAPEQHDRVFRAFEQQHNLDKPNLGGTGLGLAITKRLLEMMNGEVLLQSTPGKGSRFTIIFRKIQLATEQTFNESRRDSLDPASIKFDPNKILIVDDLEESRALIKGYLGSTFPELEMFEAEDGETAIEQAKKIKPGLIFMDVVMPNMSGVEAIKQIKRDFSTVQIPIVALTASIKKDIGLLLEKYCDSYLRKPISKEDLVKEMIRFLPHQLTEPPRDATNQTSDHLTELDDDFESIKGRSELTSALSSTVNSDYFRDLSENMMMNRIQEFAEAMRTLGDNHHASSLVKLATHLLELVDSFDVENIPEALNAFPALLEKLENLD